MAHILVTGASGFVGKYVLVEAIKRGHWVLGTQKATKHPRLLTFDLLKDAIKKGDNENTFEEIGDSLFSIVNIARFLDYDSESALRSTIRKFENRFNQIEDQLKTEGRTFKESSLLELDKIWNEIKKNEN